MTATPLTSQRAAVSDLSAALVRGPVRLSRVVASSRLGCYLLLDDVFLHVDSLVEDGAADPVPPGATVLPVLTPAALALPTAVRLADDRAPALKVGEQVEVGEGRITGPGWVVEVVRTYRPSRVRRSPDSTDGSSPESRPKPGPNPSVGEGRGDRTALRDLLETRLGLGPGLTPQGDDEIAGHLLVAAATGAAVPDLEPHLHRTTALSASLLRAAAAGYAVPSVVAYVDAVLAHDHLTLSRLRPAIEAIGHTSGPALLRGIHAAALHAATVNTAALHPALAEAIPNERTDVR